MFHQSVFIDGSISLGNFQFLENSVGDFLSRWIKVSIKILNCFSTRILLTHSIINSSSFWSLNDSATFLTVASSPIGGNLQHPCKEFWLSINAKKIKLLSDWPRIANLRAICHNQPWFHSVELKKKIMKIKFFLTATVMLQLQSK